MTEKKHPSDLDKSMGKNLKKLREKYNLSLTDLSISMNTSYKTIWSYENGFNSISIPTLINIQKIFSEHNVTLEDVFRFIVIQSE